MRVFALDGGSDGSLAASLEAFERQFSYPLGRASRFSVHHGADYTRFFRAMGTARCFFAEKEGRIIGSLGVAIRPIGLPDLSERTVGYIGDVKISPDARGGRILFRLASEAMAWNRLRTTEYFGVVMDGTAATPDSYSGRAGLPGFRVLAKVVILRIATEGVSGDHDPAIIEVEPHVAAARFREVSTGRYSTPCVYPVERSSIAPIWLMQKEGSACGCLEDTRRAKRLIREDGGEIVSAHLTSFAYLNARSAVSLIAEALRRALKMGFTGLFVAVPERDFRSLVEMVGEHRTTLAPATVFGHGLVPGMDWNLNSSEV